MRRASDGLVSVLARHGYRLEVWKMSTAPKQNGAVMDGDYFYLTKRHHNGEIGERSIGLPRADVEELLRMLQAAL